MNHERFMKTALNLARRGIGTTGPNPTVGCVIVKNGTIISQGRTAIGGRPHAEPVALKKAGAKTKGSTIYVTLEPCSHHGRTPPCAEALIKAKPAEVVISCLDPDKRVNGRGIQMLAKAGIKVTIGTGEKEALEINRGFIKRVKYGLPFVTLKIATGQDGKYLKGEMFTSEIARNYVHLLRSRSDVLITGTGTIKTDKPKLNVRLNGLEHTSPLVIILGKSKLPGYQTEYIPLKKLLKKLATEGVNNILLECGPTLAAAFLKAKLVDELQIIESPEKFGKRGLDFFDSKIKKQIARNFRKTAEKHLGVDILRIFRKSK